MLTASDLMINTIADTLLHVGERVMCVSKDATIVNVWDSPGYAYSDEWATYVGQSVSAISNDALIGQIAGLVAQTLATGQDGQGEYVVIKHDHPSRYKVRVMNISAREDLVFVVFETLDNSVIPGIDTEAWKTALDAVGNGMWDMNMTTNRAFFSDKWHRTFGGNIVDINTIDDWAAIVHPEDYKNSVAIIQQYLAGNLSSYSCELRYKCRDGKYKWILSRGVVVAKDKDGKPLRAIGTPYRY